MDARLSLIAALSGLSLLAGCRQAREPREPSAPPAEASPEAEPVVIRTPPLDRAGLLDAVRAAASTYASGGNARSLASQLEGRKFALTFRFGCFGPGAKGDPAYWALSDDGERLTVSVTPDLALDPSMLAVDSDPEAGTNDVEAIEGFWVPHPWLLADACPRSPTEPRKEGAGATPGSTVGIAQIFTSRESRIKRRAGRPYVHVARHDPAEPAPADGFRLRVEGRLRSWPGGGVIRCAGPAGTRPICVMATDFDRVAIERPADSSLLADWTG